jgi:hypothetical protein
MFISPCEPSLWGTYLATRVFYVHTQDYELFSHSLFTYSVWSSQLTAVISLNSISWADWLLYGVLINAKWELNLYTVVPPYPLIQYPLIHYPWFQLSAVYRGPKKNCKVK